MKNRSITFKLFIITVIFFACFYAMVILSQLLFFNQFYETYKMRQVEHNVEQLAHEYVTESVDSNTLSRQAIRFMETNKSQLAIINPQGEMMLNDMYQLRLNETYHLLLKQPDGKQIFVPLALMMSEYGEPFRQAHIKLGDTLTIYGTIRAPSGKQPYTVLDPQQLNKNGIKTIGDIYDTNTVKITGTVSELMLPDLSTWKISQGLLLQAINEQLPLMTEQQTDLQNMQPIQYNWTDSWSGSNNLITLYPLQKNGQFQLMVVITSIQEISDTNAALRWFYVYLGIGGFALILILSLFFSRMVTKPLIALNRMAKRMVRLDFSSSINIPPLRQQDELGGLARSMDTLARKLDTALRELQEANTQLQRDMEHKQRMEQIQQSFFTNASHELKTPLSIVKSFAEGLQDGVKIDKSEHYVNVIIEEADKMEMLIKDMLDLARLESGTIRLQPRPFMLSELSEKVANKLIYSLQPRKLAIVISPVDERSVLADPDWIEQVLRNLIINAIRHAETGSTIRIVIESTDFTTTLHVDNTGKPIADEHLEHIWERFYRAEPSRSRQTGGTGLGLPIASQILDLHGCSYSVQNLTDGVRFSIRFHERIQPDSRREGV
ncbi:HAMP domain-containing sensor histidine kinase [Paenibacillus campi]|uniref:sensor histidine kinase n=1 Tax=Paenibacillus campi TaxID=3106031 RepID=UPI002AFF4E83|nr:HAMP domain-containing sensor histidine kinase [Paenibacillus sp. SGZ-1014]